MRAPYCTDCNCEYFAKTVQLFCRDGGCDCHHESHDSGSAS